RAPWHLRKLRGLLVLGEGETARGFDGAQPRSAVASATGKEHTNATAAASFGERFKELVDSYIKLLRPANEPQRAIFHHHAFVRRLHINGIRFRFGCFSDLDYRHGGRSA